MAGFLSRQTFSLFFQFELFFKGITLSIPIMIGQQSTRSSTNQTPNSGSNSNSASNLVNSGSINTGRGKSGVNWPYEL